MSKTRRLFFAFWPSEAQQASWGKMAEKLLPSGMGRLVRPENLHVTLLFAGNVSQDQTQCLEQLAATIRAEPFTLRLDHFGHWRRPQVWWWGASAHPQSLLDVVQSLRDGASRCGVVVDQRPYQSHLTLARKVKQMPEQPVIEAVEWLVEGFALMESVTSSEGVHYKIQKRWPFKGKG